MTQDLCRALEQGATLLTSTKRLVREMRLAYDRAQAAQGRRAWPGAHILTYPAWLEGLWRETWEDQNDPPQLLTSAQELALWERVIEDSLDGYDLLDVHSTAEAVCAAWRLRHEWELPEFGPAYDYVQESQQFLAWSARFRKALKAHNWVTVAQITRRVTESITSGIQEVPRSVYLAGFDEQTPLQKRLLDCLRARGCEVSSSAAACDSQAVLLACEDARAELYAAACWARSQWESGTQRIGIVMPGLAAWREQAEQVFEEILHPHIEVDALAPRELLFHVSEGRPLSAYGPISAALLALGMAQERLPAAEVSALLRTPFLDGSAKERSRRAQLDFLLRTRGYAEAPMSAVLTLAISESQPYSCPILARAMETAQELRRTRPSRQLPSRWSRFCADLLKIAGWPGERALDSREFQAAERFRTLIAELGMLDGVLGEISQSEAIRLLRRQCGETPFQPENEGAPIQIMDEREAAGVQFDALWIAGLHDGVWPCASSLNPFLPISLQRECGTPGCSPERSLEQARTVTARLFASAPEVVCSYPRCEQDRELRPSPLVSSLPQRNAEFPQYRTVRQAMRAAAKDWQREPEECPPPLPPGTQAHRGATLFENQAACPFRAFAESRLGVRPLEQAQVGLNHRERGDLFHKTLELLWGELQTHGRLIESTDEELSSLVSECVGEALAESVQDRGAQTMRRLQQLERERLEGLAFEWLQIEKQRAPFEVIARETKRSIEAGGVTVDVKIDRIDRLEDGREILLDYKTGDPQVKQWDGDRPDKPQLPLYASTHSERVAAVSFAVLKTGAMEFRGVAESDGLLPEVKPSSKEPELAERLARWKQTLDALGIAFRESPPYVDPKKPLETCRYCGLESLCRVTEASAEFPEESDE